MYSIKYLFSTRVIIHILIHVYSTLSFLPVKVGLVMISISLKDPVHRLHSKSTFARDKIISLRFNLGEECSEEGPIFNLDNCLPLSRLLNKNDGIPYCHLFGATKM